MTYCDCDIEEPNGHIFLKPRVDSKETFGVHVPLVDETKCTHCGECSKICQYKAIMPTKKGVLIFQSIQGYKEVFISLWERIKEGGAKMKELVCISGKGGTGKTSLVASFASMAENCVLADCDLDTPDLHMILKPNILHTGNFKGGKRAWIDPDKCIACGTCLRLCRFNAIMETAPPESQKKQKLQVDPIACEGCGVCAHFCPRNAIRFEEVVNGHWYISETHYGPMIHASLGIAEKNSGKMVSLVRSQSRIIAEEKGLDLIIVDGSPGIGCPVIASLTGAQIQGKSLVEFSNGEASIAVKRVWEDLDQLLHK